ncbi:dihydroorotate dehydrogenase [Geosmithia morbida]|uniref:Dihydroorotate dehydrogenase n=1 Tax=Geosmithia morbida TaxID=1094350 RepID=A0A9P4Z1N4_9HYPO|nr:dihydroorotate dehydrogenase [Geosmithia morbida]KAF4126945.1 dihydroorotate dehydrogenase [Geosmithia morbida]
MHGLFRQAATRRSGPRQQRRYASSSPSSSSSAASGLKLTAYGGALAASLLATYLYATDTRASVHASVMPWLIRTVFSDAEDAHHAGTVALKALYEAGLNPRERDGSVASAPELATTVLGDLKLSNPIAISAGLDKNADIPDVLFDFGAGMVEVGGCTARPQGGNPRPRMFRVVGLDGLVNRYGLNSCGADKMAIRLRDRVRRFARRLGLTESDVLQGRAGVPRGSLRDGRLLAVQIAKNKDTDGTDERAVADDHAYCVRRLAPYADVLVVNVSSPNTPGLRDLQATGPLTRLLATVVSEAAASAKAGNVAPPKVMVKVSPDEDDDDQIGGIVAAVSDSGVDGVIVGNTTKRRDGLASPARAALLDPQDRSNLAEEGGYSGPAMFDRTLSLVGRYRQALKADSLKTGGQEKAIFATGGVTDGEQALKLLNAGASVAMVYTAMVYGGAGTVTRIKTEMRDAIKAQS